MSIVKHAPTLTLEEAANLAERLYGVRGTLRPLPSERDQNFLLDAGEAKYVLKIANAMEERALLVAQNEAMTRAAGLGLLPQAIRSTRGEEIEEAPSNGEKHFIRLIAYLNGTPMGGVKRHSSELLYDLGDKLGRLDGILQRFDTPALHRRFHWDLAHGLEVIRANCNLLRDATLRRMVSQLTANFEKHTSPLLSHLRTSVVYNDANDNNILVGGGADIYSSDQTVTGFIDLGDMTHSYTVSDLAVAIAYAILNKPNPLETAANITKGYHASFPLREDEIAALWGLATLRLCMSVCIAAEQRRSQPANAYLNVSQKAIRATLPKLLAIHPRFAEAALREACGLPPSATSSQVVKWLKGNAASFASILSVDLRREKAAVFDLSVGSPIWRGDPHDNVEPQLTRRLNVLLEESGAQVGIGQYNEARYVYVPSMEEACTIHLGVDLFAKAGAPVRAPLAGKVAALTKTADSTPTVVLEHEIAASGKKRLKFFTLYSRLDKASFKKLKLGQRIRKGQRFAAIGSSVENGGRTPQVHVQILLDDLDLGVDFPRAAPPSQRDVWLGLCPDPNLILNIPERIFPKHAPSKDKTFANRRRRLGGNLSVAYRSPVKVVRGWMQYLFDEQGRKYLDAYNNVAHVGHCHPRMVETLQRQSGVLNTNTRYLHDNINKYAERLTALLPDTLEVCYFTNSASEANELALRLARAYAKQKDMIVLEAAYHGNTTSLIDISPYKHDGPGGEGAPEWTHTVPIPDVFRGEFKADDPQAGAKYALYVQRAIESLRARGRGLAGYIAESLPSVGGQIVFPAGYLADVYRYVRAAGGVCIADEVQTGLGRVGSHMWGFEMQNVTPDIVVIGKPVGNGHPLAAVIARRDIAAAFDNGMEYFNTFGGNPVSCAVGLAVLDVLRDERLQQNAFRVGGRLLEGLKSFVGKYDMVADARGAGLFLGLELVSDRSVLTPAASEAAFIANRMRDCGILLGTDGPYHNVVKIRPPMPFNESNAEFLLETLETILKEDFSHRAAD